MLASLFRGGA